MSRDFKNFQFFWSNHNLDLRSYGQLLSLFFMRIYYIIYMKDLSFQIYRSNEITYIEENLNKI